MLSFSRSALRLPARTVAASVPARSALAPWKSRRLLSTSSRDEGAADITTLPNGLRVASIPAGGHFAAVGLYVDAGSRYETPGTAGHAHLIERMAFKSTAGRSAQEMTSEIESMGGTVMCSASRESIMYQAAVFPHDIERALSVIAETVQSPRLLDAELDMVREQVPWDVADLESKPEMLLPEYLHAEGFKGNTVGNPLMCPIERLNVVTPASVREYMSTWFTPDRMVIAGLGLPHEELVRYVEKHFAQMPSYKPELSSRKAEYTGGSVFIPNEEVPFSHMHIGFEGVGINSDEIYPLATLQMLLGGGGSFSAGGPGKGMYSRLYTSVLNNFYWIESCQAFNYVYNDTGLFGISTSCKPGTEASAFHTILAELGALAFGPNSFGTSLTPRAVSRAKNQLRSSVLMNLESRMVMLEDLGRQVQLRGERVGPMEMSERIQNVSAADVERVASKLLKSKPTIVGYGNAASWENAAESIL
ncbi:LuxS/MPP-like metallohydrolase [Ramicandelaber brevisporus]|nr:LuxS/MPP-like metallohydrolase [Ramicandelaber brevisporus]